MNLADTTNAAATRLPQDQAAQVAAPDVSPSDLTRPSGDTGQMAITDAPVLYTRPDDAAVVPGTVSGDRGLEVANSASPAEVQFGDPLSYTLTVSALGTLSQTAVVVRDGIPRGTTYASGSAACDSSPAARAWSRTTTTR